MPAPNPLSMPVQSFSETFQDSNAPGWKHDKKIWFRRVMVLLPAIALTTLLLTMFFSWQSLDTINALVVAWLLLVGITFLWITFVVGTTCAGLYRAIFNRKVFVVARNETALNVAIVVPIFNESPIHVLGNVAAMCEQLNAA
jgi:membrane glycosyltransferase